MFESWTCQWPAWMVVSGVAVIYRRFGPTVSITAVVTVAVTAVAVTVVAISQETGLT